MGKKCSLKELHKEIKILREKSDDLDRLKWQRGLYESEDEEYGSINAKLEQKKMN